MDDVGEALRIFLDYVGGKEPEDSFVRKLDEAVKEAKKDREWRHEYMTLLMRDRENMEKGIEKGIRAMVSVLREYNIPDRDIVEKLQDKFKISQDEAKSYL